MWVCDIIYNKVDVTSYCAVCHVYVFYCAVCHVTSTLLYVMSHLLWSLLYVMSHTHINFVVYYVTSTLIFVMSMCSTVLCVMSHQLCCVSRHINFVVCNVYLFYCVVCHVYVFYLDVVWCRAEEGFTSHMWMSHGTHMNESDFTCEWVMSHMQQHSHVQIGKFDVLRLNESRHTYEGVMSHAWMS